MVTIATIRRTGCVREPVGRFVRALTYHLCRVKSILAIDAAWTVTEPSGIALLRGAGHDWTCVGLAPSQAQFLTLADGTPVDWSTKPTGHVPAAAELIDAAHVLLDGATVDVVTIDMPIATAEISGGVQRTRRYRRRSARMAVERTPPT